MAGKVIDPRDGSKSHWFSWKAELETLDQFRHGLGRPAK